MVFSYVIVFDQSFCIDHAIASDGISSVDEGVVHDDRPLPPTRPGVKRGPEEPRRRDASYQVVTVLNS